MNRIDRYIARYVILGTLGMLAVLVSLFALPEIQNELGDVGRGHYGVSDVLLYVSLQIPKYAEEVFPVATLLGSLFGLGVLARHSELIAMRASGISLARIVGSTLKAGVVLAALAMLISDLIAPEATNLAQQWRSEAQYGQLVLKTKYGFWARDGRTYVNIRRILPAGRLGDVYLYEYDAEQHLRMVTHAGSARLEDDKWLIEDGSQSEFTPTEVRSRHLDKAIWTSFFDPVLVKFLVIDPMALPSWGLYRYILFLRDNGQQAANYEVAFWTRIFTPLIVFVMLFLSVPFVMGNLRVAGVGPRMLAGAILGTSFLLLNRAFADLSIVFNLDPLFASTFPGLLCLGVALWASHRV